MKTNTVYGRPIAATSMKRITIRRTIFKSRYARSKVFTGVTCLVISCTYRTNLKQINTINEIGII